MGGAPDSWKSLTYPINKGSTNELAQAMKAMALWMQRSSVRVVGVWSKKGGYNDGRLGRMYRGVLKKLGGDTALLASRLAQMGRYKPFTQEELRGSPEVAGRLQQLMAEMRGSGMMVGLADRAKMDVVDSTSGAVNYFEALFGRSRSLVVETDPEVPVKRTRNEDGKTITEYFYLSPEHNWFKMREVLMLMRAFAAMKKLDLITGEEAVGKNILVDYESGLPVTGVCVPATSELLGGVDASGGKLHVRLAVSEDGLRNWYTKLKREGEGITPEELVLLYRVLSPVASGIYELRRSKQSLESLRQEREVVGLLALTVWWLAGVFDQPE